MYLIRLLYFIWKLFLCLHVRLICALNYYLLIHITQQNRKPHRQHCIYWQTKYSAGKKNAEL